MTTTLALFFGLPTVLLLLATGGVARLRRPSAVAVPAVRRRR